MEMAEHDAEVGDGFFDSEDDDAPVDMAVVYEAMKHVPLPDFDYADRGVATPTAPVAAAAAAAPQAPDVPSSEAAAPKDAGQGKKKSTGRPRSLKRVKLAGTATSTEEKTLPKTTVKGGGNRIATAAKVAAKVAPNVVTGGVVAEAGPRPDFSLWTVEDDLLLENAMEAGAAVEALAKGAMRFSHRFTVRELRERWRALLYDPELSAEASARMVEAEAALSDLPPKAGGSQVRHVKDLEQKRRSNSIRSLYHKRKRSLTEGKPISATESQTPDEGAIREAEEKLEEGKEKLVVAPLSTMPLGNVDPGLLEGLLSPKGGATDFDNTFTQMVSLLAAGGVGAVFGALPGNSNVEVVEDQKRGQESQGDELVLEAVMAAPKVGDVAIDQCQSQTSIMLGGNDKLNLSAQVVPIEQEVLQLPSVQLDRKEQIEEGDGAPQVLSDKNATGGEGFDGAASNVGNSESNLKDTRDLIVSQPPAQATTATPVTEKNLVCLSETLLVATGSETAHIEVGGRTEHITQEPFGSVSLNADPSVVHTEQLFYVQSVKAEKVPETIDIGSTLGAEILHRPPVLHIVPLSYEQSVKAEKVAERTDIGSTLGAEILHRPPVLHIEPLSYEQSVKAEKLAEKTDIGSTLGAEILHRPPVLHIEPLSYEQSMKAEKLAETTDIGSTLGAEILHRPPVLHIEPLSYDQSVKVEKVAETTDIGCTLGAEIQHRPPVLQESHGGASKFSDEIGGEGYVGSHERLKHGGLNSIMDQGQEQDLESDPDQERYFGSDQDQDLESDHDFESEQRFSYIESDYDGEYYASEGLDVRAEDELLYAPGSPETLLDHDFSMLVEPSEHVQAEPIDEIMIDPILGPVVCALSTEDTEVPDLYDVLPLPLPETTLNYNSDGGLRDGYLLEFTSPDDEADLPSSPSEFHVYEEWESSDALREQVHAPKSGDGNVWGPELSAGKQGRAFPQSSSQNLLADNLSPNSFGGRPVKDEAVSMSDFDGENQLIQFPALQLQPSDFDGEVQRASDTAGKLSSTVQHTQWQPVPAEVDPVFYHGDIDPLTGQEGPVREDPETGVLRSDEEASALEIAEEELESDGDTRFSDVEAMIMNMDLDPGVDDEFSALEESRRMYRRQRRMLVRLEQNFSSAMQRSLTKRKALAILYGRHLLYYMTKTEVVMGRMTQDNVVDIDLGKEGRANKVSRQQASLKLKEDGVFYLRNLGRRSLTVNNIAVDIDQRAILGSNCLIEVGGMCFIFEINKKLVQQQVARMHRDA